ncbi:hypothetical protein A4X13_0g6576 [Tilletia indica]|uniref:Brl1/Brr6 domain-containing protein n=1 Tax=Tilletia indica TaxID=43049 RepID=A0A177TAL5_9BASI|nr:hypothetical protein A4X13_0g6575 [Tilletia indica]KAE8244468.1 hypothetical protein A4X13_0g6576 [Tilletia indica]
MPEEVVIPCRTGLHIFEKQAKGDWISISTIHNPVAPPAPLPQARPLAHEKRLFRAFFSPIIAAYTLVYFLLAAILLVALGYELAAKIQNHFDTAAHVKAEWAVAFAANNCSRTDPFTLERCAEVGACARRPDPLLLILLLLSDHLVDSYNILLQAFGALPLVFSFVLFSFCIPLLSAV